MWLHALSLCPTVGEHDHTGQAVRRCDECRHWRPSAFDANAEPALSFGNCYIVAAAMNPGSTAERLVAAPGARPMRVVADFSCAAHDLSLLRRIAGAGKGKG